MKSEIGNTNNLVLKLKFLLNWISNIETKLYDYQKYCTVLYNLYR